MDNKNSIHHDVAKPNVDLGPLSDPILAPKVHKSNRKIVLTSLIGSLILLILCVGLIVYFLPQVVRTEEIPKQVSLNGNITTTPTQDSTTLTPDPATANWQEHVMEGYTIKYPKDWYVKNESTSENGELLMYLGDQNPPTKDNKIVTLQVQDIYLDRAVRFLNFADAGLKTAAESVTESTINGLQTYKAVTTFSQFDSATNSYIEERKSYQILLPLGDKTLRILSDIKDKKLLDQIFSTFRIDQPPLPASNCVVGGCSGELCVEKNGEDVMSTCMYKEEFACYKKATCEIQQNGICGWTDTPELASCLKKN